MVAATVVVTRTSVLVISVSTVSGLVVVIVLLLLLWRERGALVTSQSVRTTASAVESSSIGSATDHDHHAVRIAGRGGLVVKKLLLVSAVGIEHSGASGRVVADMLLLLLLSVVATNKAPAAAICVIVPISRGGGVIIIGIAIVVIIVVATHVRVRLLSRRSRRLSEAHLEHVGLGRDRVLIMKSLNCLLGLLLGPVANPRAPTAPALGITHDLDLMQGTVWGEERLEELLGSNVRDLPNEQLADIRPRGIVIVIITTTASAVTKGRGGKRAGGGRSVHAVCELGDGSAKAGGRDGIVVGCGGVVGASAIDRGRAMVWGKTLNRLDSSGHFFF